MRRSNWMVVVCLLWAAPAFADEPTPLWNHGNEKWFARASDIEVGVLIGLDAKDAWWKTDARSKWAHACRLGSTLGLTELEKRLILRPRPDGSDLYSSPSGHSGMAFVSATGWRYSIAVQVPFFRQAAGKHYLSDTAAGAAQGAALQWLCNRFIKGRTPQ